MRSLSNNPKRRDFSWASSDSSESAPSPQGWRQGSIWHCALCFATEETQVDPVVTLVVKYPVTGIHEKAALKMHRIIAAVKKLVVGSVLASRSIFGFVLVTLAFLLYLALCPSLGAGVQCNKFTLNKSECFKQAFRLNVRAWNNRRGFRFYFIGFID